MFDALVTGRRATAVLVCATLGVLAWRAWPAAETKPATRHRTPTYTVVPLAGEPLRYAAEDGSCLPFLRPLIAYRDWQLQIARGSSGCLGDSLAASFTVHADGAVDWQQPNLPNRYLALTDEELAQIRALDQVSCARTEDEAGYYVGWYRIGVGSDPMVENGARAYMPSPMATTLDHIFDAAQARYRHLVLGVPAMRRLLEARPFVRGGWRIVFRDHHVAVSRRGHVWAERDLDDSELVDLIDDLRYRGLQPAERGPFETMLARLVDDATYAYEQR